MPNDLTIFQKNPLPIDGNKYKQRIHDFNVFIITKQGHTQNYDITNYQG